MGVTPTWLTTPQPGSPAYRTGTSTAVPAQPRYQILPQQTAPAPPPAPANPEQVWQQFRGYQTNINGLGYNWDQSTGSYRLHHDPAAPAPTPTTPNTDVVTGAQGNLTADQAALHTQSARRLNLLRMMLGDSTTGGINALKAQLAQRGTLDSGQLSTGIGNLVNYKNKQMAEGTQNISLGETDALMKQIADARQRAFEADQARQAQAAAAAQTQAQINAQRENERRAGRSGFLNSIITGGAGVIGGGLTYLGNRNQKK